MKNIFTLIVALSSGLIVAQVAIGKTTISSSSVSLEFGIGNKGMILPWVTSTAAVTSVVDGTMVYDLTDKRVKVKYTTGWKDFSIKPSGSTVDPVTNIDGIAIQNPANENTSAKTAIGTLSATPGILVLEDSNKAMVLPKVASPHLNIINPSPGMIVYDTFNKQLAIFNGRDWSFWKA